MISWENSQNTDIALHTMKENASFGTGLHLVTVLMVKRRLFRQTKTLDYPFLWCLCQRHMVDDRLCQKVHVGNQDFRP